MRFSVDGRGGGNAVKQPAKCGGKRGEDEQNCDTMVMCNVNVFKSIGVTQLCCSRGLKATISRIVVSLRRDNTY